MIEQRGDAATGGCAHVLRHPDLSMGGSRGAGLLEPRTGVTLAAGLEAWRQGDALARPFVLRHVVLIGVLLEWAWRQGDRGEAAAIGVRAAW